MPSPKRHSLSDLKKFVQSKKSNICYLSGDDDFFIEESLEHIKTNILKESTRDFNYDIFYGSKVDISRVCDGIQTLPIMTNLRLVILRQAHKLKDSDWKNLSRILKQPVASTFLVFTGDKPDGRKTIIKEVMKSITHFHFAKPYDRELLQWIQYICKKHSVTMEEDGARLLLQIVGSQLLDIQNEILKLSQYCGEGKKILLDDVINVASKIKLQNVFQLTNAIGKGNQVEALAGLSDLLENGQNEVSILAMIHRHIRLIRQIRVGEEQGLSHYQLSSFAGVPHFFLNEYISQARMWDEKKIEKTYKILCDTDRALKSSSVSNHIWLENLIMQTCQ